MLCIRKFPAAKKFMDKREGEVSNFSVEFLLSHGVEKCRRGTIYSLFNFGHQKSSEKGVGGGEGGVSRFSVQIVLSQSADNFRRVTLLCCVSENF